MTGSLRAPRRPAGPPSERSPGVKEPGVRRAAPRAARAKVADDVSMFSRLRLEPAYKAVSSEIERSILSGQIQPGMPLPTEQSLKRGAITWPLHVR